MNPSATTPSLVEAFSGMRADYAAAKQGRFRRRRRGIPSMGSSADYHYQSEADFLRMIEYARDFARNDMIIPQGVERLLDNFLQGGFSLDPQTGDKDLDADLRARWKAWAEDPDQCDEAGEASWCDIERLVPRHVIVDGDICVLPLQSGKLELMEAHRLRTPARTTRDVVHGVMLDRSRRRLEYWFTEEDVSPLAAVSLVREVRRIPARDAEGKRQVLHVYRSHRVSQTRGVTAFHPIFDAIGMHDDIQFAKLLQQQIVSCVAFFRERPAGALWAEQPAKGATTTEPVADGTSRIIEGISPGLELTGRPGEKLTGFSPNIPNAEFFQHVMLILQFVAGNLDLPLQVLLLDPTKTNFSGWRGAIDQAKIAWRRWQAWEIRRLHCPVYRWKVDQWTTEDAALAAASRRSDVDLFAHRWNPPEVPYIEPLTDAQADTERLKNLLASPRRVQADRGRDWEEIVVETVADNSTAIRAALEAAEEINAEFPGAGIGWRELLSLQQQPAGTAAPAAALARSSPREGSPGADGQDAQDQNTPIDEAGGPTGRGYGSNADAA